MSEPHAQQQPVATSTRDDLRSETRLPQATEADMRALLALSPEAVIISDQDGRIQFVNHLAATLFGYAREDLLGQSIEQVIPEHLRAVHQQRDRIDSTAAPRPRPIGSDLELFGRRQDGSEFPVEISLGPLAIAGELHVINTLRDVTERKRVEVEAAAGARRLQVVFDTMADGVVVYDQAARILEKNAAAHALLGTDRYPEVLDLPVQERVAAYAPRDERDQPMSWQQWPALRVLRGEVLRGQAAVDLQVRALDGREIAVRVSGAPMRDAGGQIVGAVCVLRDVTEHQRLEQRTHAALQALLAMAEALVRIPDETLVAAETELPDNSIERQLANLTRSILGSSFVTVVRLASESELLQPLATVGLSPEQEREWHAGLRDAQLVDRMRESNLLAQFRAGKVLSLDPTQLPSDVRPAVGHIQTCLVVPILLGTQLIGILSINDNRPQHLYQDQEIALARAVSRFAAVALEWERLLAERHARTDAEARLHLLQAILEELPCSVSLAGGHDARLLFDNRSDAEMWGAPWPEGQPFEGFLNTIGTRILDPNGLPLAPRDWATLRAARLGEAVRQQQTVVRHADGTSVPLLVSALPLDSRLMPTAGEAHEALVLTVRDDVTTLVEGERLKDEFVALAVHELRNPATTLKAALQLLQRRAQRGELADPASWRSSFQTLLQTIDRLAQLTDDLLDVTRLQAGRLVLHPEPHDLVAVIRSVIKRQRLATEHHTLTLHATAGHITATFDVRRIEQVLVNLLKNAIKYSPDGGTIHIEVLEEREKGVAELRIRDHGIGIPTAYHARIFSRFARADNARAREIAGTGLGLYLCRELIERHGGHIWFESAEGQGSTFFVTLPLADAEAEPTVGIR